MNFVPRLTSRMAIILCHDVVVTALALLCSLYFTFPDGGLATRAGFLATLVPVFSLYAGSVFVLTGLYRPKWRFTSMPDLISIAKASLILAITLLIADYVLVSPNIFGDRPRQEGNCRYFVLQMFFLSAPRVAYRYFRHGRTGFRVRATKPWRPWLSAARQTSTSCSGRWRVARCSGCASSAFSRHPTPTSSNRSAAST